MSAIVCIVIRAIDKNQNAKESVKKYADRRQKEFEEYFKKQTEDLKFLQSELESHDSQAVAAVKKLDSQKAEFDNMAEDLAGQVARVDEISGRIDSYDSAIQNLMEMTSAVEQNLQRIKDEADIIDKFNARLDEQKKKIISIDKQIPALVEKFSDSNEDSLKHLGENLLDEYESRARSISDSTSQALEENRVIMEKIASDIKATYESASERAQTLEDEAFAQLKDTVNTRNENLLLEIDTQTKQLQALIDGRIETAQESINEQTENFNASLDGQKKAFDREYEIKVKEISDSLNARMGEIHEEFAEKLEKLEQFVVDRTNSLDNACNEKTNALAISFNENSASIASMFQEKAGDLESSFNEKLQNLILSFSQKTKDFEDEYNTRNDSLSSAFNAQAALLENTYKENTSQLISDFDDKRKNAKIGNLLTKMRKADIITTAEKKRWKLTDEFKRTLSELK